ncbi:MAG: glycosyltransferase family 9 protein, partial [Candidatus Zixiibacteriota bacterium]
MALPMINEAREAYPGSSVTALVPDYLADLYESNPAIDKLIQIPSKYVHGLIAVKKITDLISPHNFDIGYILPPSFGAASSFKLGGVKERIGYIADGRRLLLSKPLPLPTPLNSEHRSEVYFNLLRRGSSTSIPYVKPKLFLNDTDIRHAIELLGGFGIGPEDRYVVIAHRAVAESRRWGTEKYAEVSRRLATEFGTKVVLVGGADDRSAGEEIVESIGGGNVFNLAGKTSLRESAAIMSRARL